MRRLIVSTQISLDGVTEAPERWAAPFWQDPSALQYALDELNAAGLLLMGRRTYEGFLGYWPHAPQSPIAERMNSLPKAVASTTLRSVTWNAELIDGDVADGVKALKEQPGQDIMLFASSTLTHSLLATGLIDEFRLRLVPALAGAGRRLFPDRAASQLFQLRESRTFSSGVMVLSYVPAGR